MPDKVQINESLGLMTVISYGVVTSYHIRTSLDLLNDLKSQGKVDKVLVDSRDIEVFPSFGELASLSDAFPAKISIAVVIREEHAIVEDLRFLQFAVSNNGARIRLFSTVAEAKEWLFLQESMDDELEDTA